MISIFLAGVNLMGHGAIKGIIERIDMMKVMKIEPNEKAVEFSKSETHLNEFCQSQPVSEFIRKEMEEVHRDFTRYMREQYFDDVQSIVKEFIDEHHPQEEKRQSLEDNLFWWKVLYESNQEGWNCTDQFIEENGCRFMDKPLIVSWLKEWGQAATKFYYVGYKYSDHVFFCY
jgi:cobalamin biosynthesis Mg chelatase CobN